MPAYDYKCFDCNYVFEKFQSINDESIKICPKCHKESVERIMSSVGISFKGSGFYINDSKPSSTGPASK